MKIQLPEPFLESMQRLLPKQEYQAFTESYQDPSTRTLTYNTLKTNPSFITAQISGLKTIPFLDASYQVVEDRLLGVTPFHHAGLFYLQEPSAVMVSKALGINTGDVVLDMCAAPGGKSIHILNQLQQTGYLLANEIHPERNRILCENLERWGASNYTVTQANGAALAKDFPNTFDVVVLDAPCSGESLYRRNPDLVATYTPKNAFSCAKIQLELLENAYHCVKTNGRIVYSTCTFNTIENEDVLFDFLNRHSDCQLLPLQLPYSRPGFGLYKDKVSRYFPMDYGEGHFIAAIQVNKEGVDQSLKFTTAKAKKLSTDVHLTLDPDVSLFSYNQAIISNPVGLLKSSVYIRQISTMLFMQDKQRIKPCHSGALSAIDFKVCDQYYELTQEQAYLYLNGQAIAADISGWCIVTYQQIPLGFAKGSSGRLNNHYPKRLRNLRSSY